MKHDKIGIGIVTYNSEPYFKELWDSLQRSCARFDELVVVNGGNKYEGNYECSWIQHNINYYPAVCRNDAINFLMQRNCDYIFLIEDDMLIKDKDIFNKYIKASKETGLKYFSFVSMSANTGSPGERKPLLTVNYKNDVSISFYQNMCNEFTMHHKSCFEKVGLYDTQFRDPFDIDLAYRESLQDYSAPFWWFADIEGSDDLVMNNPVATSRLQANDRPDGSRNERIIEQFELFNKKHGMYISQIPMCSQKELLDKLKIIKPPSKL